MNNPDIIELNIDFKHPVIFEILQINLEILNKKNGCTTLIEYGSNQQFSKGYRRLYDWFHLKEYGKIELSYNKYIKFDSLESIKSNEHLYYFCLSGLIILFQVFSDGNHRTAEQYYLLKTKKKISIAQMCEINSIFNIIDYYNFRIDEHKMYKNMEMIVNYLVKIYNIQ